MLQIDCRSGFFRIHENTSGQIGKFMSLFQGIEIVSEGSYFTFEPLQNAPTYSIRGGTYLGAMAKQTIAGEPWEIFAANDLVFNISTGKIVQKTSIVNRAQLESASFSFLSKGLLQPGSIAEGGLRVKDYAAWFSFDTMQFKYTAVTYG